MAIVTWADYNSLYSKVKTQTEFDYFEALAEKEVKRVVGAIKWATITNTTFGYDVLKDCICNVIDKLYEDMANGKGKGVKSVTNDGYSETYEVTNASALQNENASAIKLWLSGTGLVGAY